MGSDKIADFLCCHQFVGCRVHHELNTLLRSSQICSSSQLRSGIPKAAENLAHGLLSPLLAGVGEGDGEIDFGLLCLVAEEFTRPNAKAETPRARSTDSRRISQKINRKPAASPAGP